MRPILPLDGEERVCPVRYNPAMPELPEVECVRRTLADQVVGRRILAVRVNRPDVIMGSRRPADLLAGQVIHRIDRLGKQLALIGGEDRACVVVHLGMSGQLRLAIDQKTPGQAPIKRPTPSEGSIEPSIERTTTPPHCHLIWRFEHGRELRFIDPRRFGGLWTFDSTAARDQQRWHKLGPDALRITPARLERSLSRTQRAIKAALLDQSVIAGLGNIYVDELLFGCKLHPLTPAHTLKPRQIEQISRQARTLLTRAIASGGSTLRDYVDADGQTGGYQQRHRVYGRAGQRCLRRTCRAVLETGIVGGRTTVWCPACQPKP